MMIPIPDHNEAHMNWMFNSLCPNYTIAQDANDDTNTWPQRSTYELNVQLIVS